jgi:hypothetical protein
MWIPKITKKQKLLKKMNWLIDWLIDWCLMPTLALFHRNQLFLYIQLNIMKECIGF